MVKTKQKFRGETSHKKGNNEQITNKTTQLYKGRQEKKKKKTQWRYKITRKQKDQWQVISPTYQ